MLVGIKKYVDMLIMGISALILPSFSFLRDVNPDALKAYVEYWGYSYLRSTLLVSKGTCHAVSVNIPATAKPCSGPHRGSVPGWRPSWRLLQIGKAVDVRQYLHIWSALSFFSKVLSILTLARSDEHCLVCPCQKPKEAQPQDRTIELLWL